MGQHRPKAKEPRDQPEQREGQDARNPAAKPQGTTQDQIANMESEGQAQPQADETAPDSIEQAEETAGDHGGVS